MSPHVLYYCPAPTNCFVLALLLKFTRCSTSLESQLCSTLWVAKTQNVWRLCRRSWAFFSRTFPPRPPRGRRGRNAATLRQAPWPCRFIILLTVVLKVLKYWTEHERWWPLSLPSLVVLFKVKDSDSHASAAGLFRLTPRTITPVKEEEICVFMCDKCTLLTALSVLSKSLSHIM